MARRSTSYDAEGDKYDDKTNPEVGPKVFVGTICAFVNGVCQPLVAFLMVSVIDKIADLPLQEAVADLHIIVINFTVVGAIMFFVAYGQMCLFTLAAESQPKRICEKYLHAILRQDITWHNTGRKNESLNTRLSADTQLIYDGLADKVGLVLSSMATFVASFVIAFTHDENEFGPLDLCSLDDQYMIPPRDALSLMFSSIVSWPIIPLHLRLAVKMPMLRPEVSPSKSSGPFVPSLPLMGKSGNLKFSDVLSVAYASGVKKAIATGLSIGDFVIVMFCSFALAFWYGAREVKAGNMNPIDVVTVLFGTVIGAFSIGNVRPSITNFGKAQAAAYTIFMTIDRVTDIDSFDPTGLKPENLTVHIVVSDVNFAYPSRPNVPILKNMDIESDRCLGGGKPTIVGLLERLYNPSAGSITIDGVELKKFNVRHLRDSIGLVSQEPDLFNATIKQNIMSGAPHRHCLCLIKNPAILLSDAATSALDTESERIVQAALENAANGRSTIVVAHRLSTIMNADLIYVMDRGVVLESGTHASLMVLGGTYTDFIAKQQLKIGGVDIGAHEDAGQEISPLLDPVLPSPTLQPLTKFVISAMNLNIPEDSEMSIARQKKEAARKLKMQKAPIGRTIQYLRDDHAFCFLGVFFAFPAFSQIFSCAITVLTNFHTLDDNFIPKTNHYSLLFFVLSIVGFFGYCGGMATFLIVGERMTRRMHYLSYKSILIHEMAFFDCPKSSTGALASRLATDSQQMFDMVSQVILNTLSSLATMGVGLGFAFSATWQMTLIILVAVFIIGVGFDEKTRKSYEKSGQVAGEAIANIRTVASLAKEDNFEACYLGYAGTSQVCPQQGPLCVLWFRHVPGRHLLVLLHCFYGGYRLVESGIISWGQMFNCMFSIVFTAMSLGYITAELPKYAKGKQSAINIYKLLDNDTTIDSDRDGLKLDQVNASLVLENVDFAYPTRQNIRIFKGVDIKVSPFQTVALVGPSGCGKSTVIALLERGYEIDSGKRGNNGSMQEAAKLSNIHNFVLLLPSGYDTNVGDKGSQLSGGQKQHIAIARALIHKPKVLLLDEATSALDSKSEKIVQECLDKARYGRTTNVIAYHLSTIQDADLILIVKDGAIVESGRHYELAELGGVYADLCLQQNL
ncbi:ATP-binding cassette, sub-B (MDR TAP), member 4 [Haplosporangium bisporale]|nr:ATP-binding cassette, sub-B (MDR TAP), member 4 [Haplosporangium bisporale]